MYIDTTPPVEQVVSTGPTIQVSTLSPSCAALVCEPTEQREVVTPRIVQDVAQKCPVDI